MAQTHAARVALFLSCIFVALAGRASAFCGFYVAGADAELYANATVVVLMREGTRTVLSMQNNYEGPPEAFALVIPVPTVLKKEQVKTLSKEVFERVDALGAPRLVEYWERDPCAPEMVYDRLASRAARSGGGMPLGAVNEGSVKIEAQFQVGEYNVVILSAKDSTGLERWLHDNAYNIPHGASDALAPYVAQGTKFFVAKVDPARVKFEQGQAVLSPLRFHYDAQDLSLPVRLGLLNSHGTQDLIVNILAKERYEVANYPNVTIPTNLRVQDEVRTRFGAFYEALFAHAQSAHPGAVVTEYSWDSSRCDPCPTPPLSESDIATLGGDVIASHSGPPTQVGAPSRRGLGAMIAGGMTLTRLHARYTRDSLGEDLIFKMAPALMGGRGLPDGEGKLPSEPVSQAGVNNFQGRYVILHAWEKPVTCAEPNRGRWGGPPDGTDKQVPLAAKNTALQGALARPANLRQLLAQPVPGISDITEAPAAQAQSPGATPAEPAQAQQPQPKALEVAEPPGSQDPSSRPTAGCAATGVHTLDGRSWFGNTLGLLGLGLLRARRARARRRGVVSSQETVVSSQYQ